MKKRLGDVMASGGAIEVLGQKVKKVQKVQSITLKSNGSKHVARPYFVCSVRGCKIKHSTHSAATKCNEKQEEKV
jgi:hypothetical protein